MQTDYFSVKRTQKMPRFQKGVALPLLIHLWALALVVGIKGNRNLQLRFL